jgi:hypothetical protein
MGSEGSLAGQFTQLHMPLWIYGDIWYREKELSNRKVRGLRSDLGQVPRSGCLNPAIRTGRSLDGNEGRGTPKQRSQAAPALPRPVTILSSP